MSQTDSYAYPPRTGFGGGFAIVFLVILLLLLFPGGFGTRPGIG